MLETLKKSFSFLGFFSILLVVFALPLFAQNQPATTSADMEDQPVEYSLPYPGILPDNPLYIFKAMRDRVVSWFISDPKNKATFDLLQADKRIAAAFALSHERPVNEQLVVTTISKGENYFSESIGQASVARQEGIEINGLLDKLINASKKHEEIVEGISRALSAKETEQIKNEAQRVSDFEKQVAKLRSH